MALARRGVLHITGDILSSVHEFRGKSRIARVLARSLGPSERALRISRNGVNFQVSGRDLLERDLLFNLGSTRRVKRAIASLAGSAECVWDVGAKYRQCCAPHVTVQPPALFFCARRGSTRGSDRDLSIL
jgi:hypothetical protein